MAIYHLSAKVIQRSAGRSAVAAAAYRSASELYDARQERLFDYAAKAGVVHSEILLPDGAPARWVDRAALWNEVEAIERRRDAVLAREVEFALPRELGRAEGIALAREFVRAAFVSRGMVADLNVHWGVGADGDAQPHAHVMLTMRKVVPGAEGQEGREAARFGQKRREWNDKALLREWRARWAEMANAWLHELGHDIRVDHRSNAAQGIVLEPQNKVGPAGMRRAQEVERAKWPEAAERAAEHAAIARRNGERIAADPSAVLAALTRQQSTFTRADLARYIHRQTDGAEQFARVLAVVEASPELVRLGEDGRGRQRLTTREMLACEQRLERAAQALTGRRTHAVALGRRQAALAGTSLGEEQRLAFGHVTRARDLCVVVGLAGTGKSTMLEVARAAWEAEGYRVRGAALSGIAAEGLEAGSGIASRTLASLEWGWQAGRGELGPGDVLVVDEAGMIGSRQLARVLTHAQARGAKVVLVGDPEQLQAIEAGAALRAVAERVGTAEITEVRRQREPWQRAATRELATGRTAEALGRYEAAGMVVAAATQGAAQVGMVAAWDAARRAAPEQSLVMLAYTRAEVAALNALARARLRAAGELGAEVVVGTERGERAFAAGDRVMFLKNERGLGVKNGTLGTVEQVDADGLTVRLDGRGGAGRAGADGSVRRVRVVLRDYGYVEHGYAATIHKAQGVTVDRAYVLASGLMDRHAAYVALTRHRERVELHWAAEEMGSREGLTRVLGRERAKDTSLDYGAGPEGPEPPEGPGPAAAERVAAAYAERRGVVPASEIVLSGGSAGQRLGARTAVLQNRVGALRLAGETALRQHEGRQQVRQAAGEAPLPGLQPHVQRRGALRALDEALTVGTWLTTEAVASVEQAAAAVAELPEVLGALVERVALRRAATAGAARFRDRYEADKRRAAAAAAAARDEQVRAQAAAKAEAERRAAAQRAAEQVLRPRPSRGSGPSPG